MKAISVIAALSFALASGLVVILGLLLNDYTLIWTFLDLYEGLIGSTVIQP